MKVRIVKSKFPNKLHNRVEISLAGILVSYDTLLSYLIPYETPLIYDLFYEAIVSIRQT